MVENLNAQFCLIFHGWTAALAARESSSGGDLMAAEYAASDRKDKALWISAAARR